MTTFSKISLLLLRLAAGWFFFSAGITKVLDPKWTALAYISSAKHFPALYTFFSSPHFLPYVNFINAWGLTLLGVSLILGAMIKISAPLGIILMALYYSALPFPHVGAGSYVVDIHILLICILILLFASNAGQYWGIDKKWR